MIANVNPVAEDFDETWNTLRYSAVAKEISIDRSARGVARRRRGAACARDDDAEGSSV